MGNFIRNIWVKTGNAALPDTRGTVWGIGFSNDYEQRFIYVLDGRHEQVHILDHASGELLSSFGRPGHQIGNFTVAHGLTVDSSGNIYVAESGTGRRMQRFHLFYNHGFQTSLDGHSRAVQSIGCRLWRAPTSC